MTLITTTSKSIAEKERRVGPAGEWRISASTQKKKFWSPASAPFARPMRSGPSHFWIDDLNEAEMRHAERISPVAFLLGAFMRPRSAIPTRLVALTGGA